MDTLYNLRLVNLWDFCEIRRSISIHDLDLPSGAEWELAEDIAYNRLMREAFIRGFPYKENTIVEFWQEEKEIS